MLESLCFYQATRRARGKGKREGRSFFIDAGTISSASRGLSEYHGTVVGDFFRKRVLATLLLFSSFVR